MRSPILTDPLPSLLWKIGWPAGLGFFFNTIYNITDAYWAGQLWVESATAMSQTLPLFLFLIVFGNGLSTPASTLIGNAIGENRDDEQDSLVRHIFFLGVILTLILTPLLVFCAPYILAITGDTNPVVQELSRAYIIPILWSAGLFLFSYLINGVLNAHGDTKTYSKTLIIGAIVNVALDPLFMYGFHTIPGMGIGGVAWSTIVVQGVSLLYMIRVAYKRKFLVMSNWTGWKPQWSTMRKIAYIGIPSALSMIFVSVGILIINSFLRHFWTDVMAVYGVGTRIEQIVLLPTIGLSIAASVIIAQNNGAKQYDRVKKTYQLALLYGIMIIIPLAITIWILSDQLYLAFIQTTDTAVQNTITMLGRQYTHIVVGLFWWYICIFITIGALQSIKRPLFGLWIGLIRQIILPLICFTIVMKYSAGYLGIWWSIFGIVWWSAVISLIVGYRAFAHIGDLQEK